jgi:hypothetical protein
VAIPITIRTSLKQSLREHMELSLYQFANLANPQAHQDTTGSEIFRQMQGSVNAIVVGVGSGDWPFDGQKFTCGRTRSKTPFEAFA